MLRASSVARQAGQGRAAGRAAIMAVTGAASAVAPTASASIGMRSFSSSSMAVSNAFQTAGIRFTRPTRSVRMFSSKPSPPTKLQNKPKGPAAGDAPASSGGAPPNASSGPNAPSSGGPPKSGDGGGATPIILLALAAAGGYAAYTYKTTGVNPIASVKQGVMKVLGRGDETTNPEPRAVDVVKPVPVSRSAAGGVSGDDDAEASAVDADAASDDAADAADAEGADAGAEAEAEAEAGDDAEAAQEPEADGAQQAQVEGGADEEADAEGEAEAGGEAEAAVTAVSTTPLRERAEGAVVEDTGAEAAAKEVADNAIQAASSSVHERVDEGKPSPASATERLDDMARSSAVKAAAMAQGHAADEMAEILRADLDKSFSADLSTLSKQELEQQVHQLRSELRDRGKWEAIRLSEFIKRDEEIWKAKFLEFAQFQHEALKREVAKMVQQIEAEARESNDAWRQRELVRLHNELQSSAQAELDKFITKARNSSAADTEERLKALAALRGKVDGIMSHIATRINYETAAHRVHQVSLAALALSDALFARKDVTDAAAALRVAGEGDALIAAAVDAIPDCAYRTGVPTLRELNDRFAIAIKEGRRAAMVPSSGGLVGQAIGTISSALFVRPDGQASEADVEGDDATKEVFELNKVFDTATKAMDDGDLATAVTQLKRLRGYPAVAVEGWISAASDRLALEQSVRMVRAHMGLLTASMY